MSILWFCSPCAIVIAERSARRRQPRFIAAQATSRAGRTKSKWFWMSTKILNHIGLRGFSRMLYGMYKNVTVVNEEGRFILFWNHCACVARPAPFSTLPNHSVLYIYLLHIAYGQLRAARQQRHDYHCRSVSQAVEGLQSNRAVVAELGRALFAGRLSLD